MQNENAPAARAPGLTICRTLAVAALLCAAVGAPAPAQTPGDDGPAARPGLFDRLFDRREYLRQSAPTRRAVGRAEREAAEAAERAEEARRDAALPPLPPRRLLPLPQEAMDDPRGERARAGSAAERARQRLMQDRLQRFLDRAARADRAALDAETAAARAARAGTVARGVDRLQSEAAARRGALGERPSLGPRPLIRMPRAVLE